MLTAYNMTEKGGLMKSKPLHPTPALLIEDKERLAAQLRRVASEIERGEVSQMVMTIVRPDGSMERIGNIPDTSKLH